METPVRNVRPELTGESGESAVFNNEAVGEFLQVFPLLLVKRFTRSFSRWFRRRKFIQVLFSLRFARFLPYQAAVTVTITVVT